MSSIPPNNSDGTHLVFKYSSADQTKLMNVDIPDMGSSLLGEPSRQNTNNSDQDQTYDINPFQQDVNNSSTVFPSQNYNYQQIVLNQMQPVNNSESSPENLTRIRLTDYSPCDLKTLASIVCVIFALNAALFFVLGGVHRLPQFSYYIGAASAVCALVSLVVVSVVLYLERRRP